MEFIDLNRNSKESPKSSKKDGSTEFLNAPSVSDKLKAPIVFNYLNYREFLKDYYSYKKQSSKGFSYRSFALRAKLQTSNYLKRIIDGERSVTNEILPRFVAALGFNQKETSYFENLVNYNQSKENDVKLFYFKKIKEILTTVNCDTKQVTDDQFELLSDWFMFPLMELCDLKNASQDPKSVSILFRNKITPSQVKNGFESLEKIGLVEKSKFSDRYEKTNKVIRYNTEMMSMALNLFHKNYLKLSENFLDTEKKEAGYFRGLTISVSKDELSEIKNKIDQFFKNLNAHYSSTDVPKDTVIQFNTNILVLTENKGEKK